MITPGHWAIYLIPKNRLSSLGGIQPVLRVTTLSKLIIHINYLCLHMYTFFGEKQ